MLLELHVRNLALIEKADLTFGEGLNILTGETGAGKSIIIGSVNLALGQKAPRDIIRTGADCAYVELLFSVEEAREKELEALDVHPDGDGLLIISRKILPSRSISRINDEAVTAAKLRQVTGLLIDIHGQHEHQSLLHASKHLEILDAYAKSQTAPLKEQIAGAYRIWKSLAAELSKDQDDEESRRREADFLRFEIQEIEAAALKEGEEEALSAEYRRYANGRKIVESLSAACEAVETDSVGRALREVNQVADLDPEIGEIQNQLYDAESILSDIRRALGNYLDSVNFDEEELARIEERLDTIRNLMAKYGGSVPRVLKSLAEKKERLSRLEHYAEYRQETERRFQAAERELSGLCERLTAVRKAAAAPLAERIREGLLDLNFLDVAFTMEFRKLPEFTANGADEAEFLISTNPGEPVRPLGAVASGGELSRIMLAIKTVLADSDAIETLIFDEIDTGISGRTAQKVSEKLAIISRSHQVICITHLPQIAAMADCHYEIAKGNEGGRTATRIRMLAADEAADELARLLGGAQITGVVRESAREMKRLADETKKRIRGTVQPACAPAANRQLCSRNGKRTPA